MSLTGRSPHRAAALALLAAVGVALSGAPAHALSRPVSGSLMVGDDAFNSGVATLAGFADVAFVPSPAQLVFADSRFDAGTVAIVYHEFPAGNPDDTSWLDIAFSLVGTAPGTLSSMGSQIGFSFDLTGMVLRLDEGLLDDVNSLQRDFASEPLDFVLPATSVFIALDDLAAPRFDLPIEAQANVAGWGTMVISGLASVPEPTVALLLAAAVLAAAPRRRSS